MKYVQGSKKRIAETKEHWENARKEVIASEADWINFLIFSGQIFKHDFTTKALAYVQNRDCTHLADFDTWKRYKRYVTKNQHSITSFRITDKEKLLHIFDISQTAGTYEPEIANLNESNKEAYVQYFNNSTDFNFESAENIVKYTIKKITTDRLSEIEDPEDDLWHKMQERDFANAVTNSIYAVVAKKHGLDDIDPFTDFRPILSYGSNEYNLVAVGNLISDTSGQVLREIETFVKAHNREKKLEERKQKLKEKSSRVHTPAETATSFFEKVSKGQNKEAAEIKSISKETQKVIPDDELNDIEPIPDIDDEFIAAKENKSGQLSLIEMLNSISADNNQKDFIAENESVVTVDTTQDISDPEDEIIEIDAQVESEPPIEIASSPKTNYKFVYATEEITFSPKKVAEENIIAIRLLEQLEKENRTPTEQEKGILAKYRGWGGIPQAFDSENSSFEKIYTELKSLLSKEDYESARASVNNAHYTDPNIIKSIYTAIERFGFNGGNILEPAMGVGNFYGTLPDNIEQNSKLFGVEIDNIPARISEKLYGKAQIHNKGFEETSFRDNTMDLIIGNVPFGDYKLHDTKYNKYNLNIHDYFFAKSIDLARPGGLIAFITSKGTLDKMNPKARELFAQKADFLGAVRLPNTAFKNIANTDATSDIIFLQKREELEILPEDQTWTKLAYAQDGLQYNQYFVENPHMMLGKMQIDERRKGMYGEDSKVTTLIPHDGNLIDYLNTALSNINAVYKSQEKEFSDELDISAIDIFNYQPYTFNVYDDSIIYVTPKSIELPKLNKTQIERVKGMIGLRESLNTLINRQANYCDDTELAELQKDLNKKYDIFVKKHGNLNDKANQIFGQDDYFNLLCTLEISADGEMQKADIFTQRTIFAESALEKVDTAQEALAISVNKLGYIDFEYMERLYQKDKETLLFELKGDIFYNPRIKQYELAEEYLSGNIKEKIELAQRLIHAEERKDLPDAQLLASLQYNFDNLNNAMPARLIATEIGVKLGSTWIEVEDYNEFIYEILSTPYSYRPSTYHKYTSDIVLDYDEKANTYHLSSKNSHHSVKTDQEFGTERMSAYYIIEDTLNLKQATVRDLVYGADNSKRYVVNKKETLLAREKQNLLKEKFIEWLWSDPERRQKYEDKYNDTFNVIRPREYDGSHLTFPGINPKIDLRAHQKNAVARIIHGKNTLLGHVVGAGKSFTMIAGIMEKKRLGISNKAMLVVPNHLTGQMGEEFLRLYPSAKILITTKKDFEKNNRKKFISRIALGNYDAVIIGHSQFEKIKVSAERQQSFIEAEIAELEDLIADSKYSVNSTRASVKRIEGQKKKLEAKLKKLIDDTKKDSFINFEQLGIDALYVDEAHMYKNGSINTKMSNIAGLGSTPSQRAMDMLLKCQYVQENNNGGGVVFATGTPISNSIAEMYTMQKYLQLDSLNQMHIAHFDQWASTFGEVTSSLELAPEGTGYRFKNRFAKFFNLPELISLFKEVADIKTAEDLNLPRPELKDGKYKICLSKPSETAQNIMQDFVNRAERIRNGSVAPHEDNMLKITHEARLLGTDPRLLKDFDFDEDLEEYEDSKLKQVIKNVAEEYKASMTINGTQIIFSDIGTPSKDTFNVYDYIKLHLIAKGIPENEICFIHDAKTDKQRDDMFEEMRQGSKRIIIGSTPKMGTGTNIQDRLVALHHVDCPFRPSDIEQREGRILRQGNMNAEVNIYRYATENTFDSYLWQMVENKQKFISQVMTSKAISRNCEDIDESVLSFAEVKAIASGDPNIKEKIELDNSISQLRILKSAFEQNKFRNQDLLAKTYPKKLEEQQVLLNKLDKDKSLRDANKKEEFEIKLGIGTTNNFTEKKDAGAEILNSFKNISGINRIPIGEYQGFKIIAEKQLNSLSRLTEKSLFLKGHLEYKIEVGDSEEGTIQRLDNALKNIDKKIENAAEKIAQTKADIEQTKIELEKPFERENELILKLNRQSELDQLLGLDKEEISVTSDGAEEENIPQKVAEPPSKIYINDDVPLEKNNRGIEYQIKKIQEENVQETQDHYPFQTSPELAQ